jgi:hypothetical protein
VSVYDVIAKQDAVRDLVIAVDRLGDNWAEADDAVRRSLWQAMHTANQRVAEFYKVYPLEASTTDEVDEEGS